jgi:gliding motility-associated-like protein
MKKIIATALLLTKLFNGYLYSQECGIIYTTPNGASTGQAGTKANPANLLYALSLVNPANSRVWLAIGNYTIDNTIILSSGITIEGGFDATTWEKSNALPTVINRSALNPDNANLALVAFDAVNQTNFRLQDLTIAVANAPSASMSTYGFRLQNCSGYNIVRCNISTGNGGNGIQGADGTNGVAGGNGANGQAGDDDSRNTTGRGGVGGQGGGGTAGGVGAQLGNGSGLAGVAGGNAPVPNPSRNGGGGGGGGCGAHDDLPGGAGGQGSSAFGNNTSFGAGGPGGGGCCDQNNANCTNPRLNGTNGSNGVNGADGIIGNNGVASHIAGFFVPGTGSNGQDGLGGQGGAGGGGGSGDRGLPVLACTFSFCTSGTGSGGGGGGGGGQGGSGGAGGTGGGGSFPIYLFANGANSNITDVSLTPGLPGNAGTGGAGGSGGIGGSGGARGTGNAEIGCGGNGGNGGSGSSGGQGGSGSNGESVAIFENGTSAVVSGNTVPGNPPVISVLNSGCINQTILFEAPIAGNWDFGTNAAPATANGVSTVQVEYSSLGRKTITYNGTVFTDFIDIFNTSGPAVDIIQATQNPIPAGCPTSFSSTLQGSFYEWRFSNPAIPDSVAGATLQTIDSVYFINPGQYEVILRVASPSSCCGFVSDTLLVNVVPNTINVAISYQPDTLCAGESATFIASPANYQQYTFFVNNLQVQNSASNTFTTNTLQPGDEVTVAAFDGSCFTNPSASAIVPFYNLPLPSLLSSDADNIICEGENISFTATGALFNEFSFIVNGVTIQNSSNNIFSTSEISNGSEVKVVGLYNGCPSDTSAGIVVQVIQVNRPDAGNDFSVCIDATIQNLNGVPAGGTWSGAGTDNVTATFSPSLAGAGVFNIIYTIFDSLAGCNARDTLVVSVNNLPAVFAGNDTAACQSATLQLNATGAITYAWSPASGLSNSNIANPITGPDTTTTYTVTGTNENGCINSDEITITIIARPVAQFNFQSNCAGLPVVFTNTSAPAGLNHNWNFGNSNTTIIENPTETYEQAGSYNVTLVADNGSCFDTLTQSVTVFELPQVNFSAMPVRAVKNEEAVVFTNETTNATLWQWSFGDDNTSTEFQPTHIYNEVGFYTITLIAENDNGCADSLSKQNYIEVYDKPVIYIPNAFSPNGDNNNDLFEYQLSGMKQVFIRIFNRWGQLLFETDNPTEYWDGTFNGKPCSADVYVYHIKLVSNDNQQRTLKGSVTILK